MDAAAAVVFASAAAAVAMLNGGRGCLTIIE
jgi:hypothetical protein